VTVFRATAVDCPTAIEQPERIAGDVHRKEANPHRRKGRLARVEPDDRGDGARMPAEVIAEIVTEPTATCSAAAMAHTNEHGRRCWL